MNPETLVFSEAETYYMQRCIELAENGLGNVAPNPMVGCVIINNGKIIGEGFHQKYGGAHAEVNAINSVKDKRILTTSTLYVNLEPCCHHGKTPPCTDLIIRHKISKVIIGCTDPAPKVAGKGIEQLSNAGCKITHGILENECCDLNKRFFTYHEKKRPYIILKWAQTLDGFISGGELSNEMSHILVHKWRSEEMAIMIGTNTAHSDNPQLNVRKWSGKNPVRVVLDKTLRLSKELHLFDRSTPTLVFTACKKKSHKNLEYINIDFKKNIIPPVLEELYKREIQSIIIEGGAQLLHSFIKDGSWDEMRVFTGNKISGNGIKAPEIPNRNITFAKDDIAGDELLIIRNKQ